MPKRLEVVVGLLICFSVTATGCDTLSNLFSPKEDGSEATSKIDGFGDVGSEAKGKSTLSKPTLFADLVVFLLLYTSDSPLYIFFDHRQNQSTDSLLNPRLDLYRGSFPGLELGRPEHPAWRSADGRLMKEGMNAVVGNSDSFTGPTGGPDGTDGWYWYESTLSDGSRAKSWFKYIPAADPNAGEPTNATDVWLATLIDRTDGKVIKRIIHMWGVSSSPFRYSARLSDSWFDPSNVLMFSTDASTDCGSIDCQTVAHTSINSNSPEVKTYSLPISAISGYGMKNTIKADKSGYGYGYFGGRIDLPEGMPAVGSSSWDKDPQNGGSGLVYWDQRDTYGVVTRTFWDGKSELTNLGGGGSGSIKVSGVDTIATPMSLGGSVSDSVAQSKSDYYSVTLKSKQSVSIKLSVSGANNLDLYLYDSAGDEVDLSRGAFASVKEISYTAPADGKYYIEVYGYEAGSYVLKVSLSVGGGGSGTINVSSVTTVAEPLSVGSSTSGTVAKGEGRFYSINLNDGQAVEITLSFSGANLDLYLYDQAGKQVKSSTFLSQSPETINYTASNNGTYFIEVYGVDGGEYILACNLK